MEKKIHSTRHLKQRKFLMILPLLTLPFITLMFWALGGGKGNDLKAESTVQGGLNLRLPDAKFKNEKKLDKLSFYEQAVMDSVKAREAQKSDPYFNRSNDSDNGTNHRSYNDYSQDANKAKVYNKLDELKQVMNKSKDVSRYNGSYDDHEYSLKSNRSSNELQRLQAMMQKMNVEKTDDPEIRQLNDMLDKIMAIQNPDKASYTPNQPNRKSLPIKTKKTKADISLLKANDTISPTYNKVVELDHHNAFYGLSNNDTISDYTFSSTIKCLIPETQTVVSGSTLKLALSSDVTVNDMNLPSGTLIYGTASISNERLEIDINSIRYQNSILPVSLSVYDMDGQEGIFIPGSINRTVAKESANKAISSMDATMVDPSIGAQAASAGIEAAKSLVGKKVKLIKVTVKSGYKVLLRNTKEN